MISNTRLQSIFGRLFRNFRMNLCKPVVDSLADRLQISGFSDPDADEKRTPGDALLEGAQPEPGKALRERAMEVWDRNRMKRRSGTVHLEAITTGDAYVIVWPDDQQRATFYPHRSHEVAVDYSATEPGKVVKAAKMWRPDERTTRLTLYYPDRVERYVSTNRAAVSSTDEVVTAPRYEDTDGEVRDLYGDGGQFDATGSGAAKADEFTEHRDDGPPVLPNPYGVVPVFHFANNADIGERGVSELWDAMPVQDALNYTVFNILVGTEFQAFRQRWATGIEIPRDSDGNPVNPFKAGPERVWVAGNSEGAEARFGEFQAADLNQLDAIKQSMALDIARVSQTPAHYFMLSTNMVSGESQKTAEQKLDAKTNDRQIAFGDTWAAAVALAVRMDRGLAADGLSLNTDWKDTKPRNEKEFWEILKLKVEMGLSTEEAFREAGYTQKQIDAMKEEQGGTLGQARASPLEALMNGLPNGLPNTNGTAPLLSSAETGG